LCGGDVRKPDHPDLPRSPKLFERADGLLDRHFRVVPVQLVEVDALELQPAEALVAGCAEPLGSRVAHARLEAVAETALRRDDDAVRIRMERLGDDLLAPPRAVDVRRVDERDAELERAAQDANTFVRVVDDAHRPEAHAADFEFAAELERRVHVVDRTLRVSIVGR
jgi:hypothetical protein